MSKNTIMVLAVIVALLAGWLVIEIASKSSVKDTDSIVSLNVIEETIENNDSASVVAGTPTKISAQVEVTSPTVASVKVE